MFLLTLCTLANLTTSYRYIFILWCAVYYYGIMNVLFWKIIHFILILNKFLNKTIFAFTSTNLIIYFPIFLYACLLFIVY